MATEHRFLVVLALASACASVPPEAGFEEAAALARERGELELAWRRGGPEEAELDRRARELLEGELTADEAVQVALLSNRRLQARYAELGFAQADVLAAARWPNPILHAELRFPEGGGRSALDLGLEQSFLGVLLMPLKKRMAAQTFAAAQLRVTAGALALAGETRAAYRRLQGRAQLAGLLRTSLEAADVSFELAQRLHDAGNVRDLDLALEEVQREEARVNVADAELAVLEAREALVALLGLHGADLEIVVSPELPELPEEAGTTEDLEGRVIANSLALAATRHEMERAAEALGLAGKTRFVPGLDLGVVAERESQGHWELGPSLALPLAIFSQGQPEQRRAGAELQRLRDTYFADATELRSRVRANAARVLALHARARFLRDSVLPLRRRIVAEVQLEYNAMQEGAFRLVLVKREELAAGAQYVATLTDYWVASSRLDTLIEGVSDAPDGAALTFSSSSSPRPASASGGH